LGDKGTGVVNSHMNTVTSTYYLINSCLCVATYLDQAKVH